jgi:hypothetical protein
MNIPRFARPPSASAPRRNTGAGGRAGVLTRTCSRSSTTNRGRSRVRDFAPRRACTRNPLPRLVSRQLCSTRRGTLSSVARSVLEATGHLALQRAVSYKARLITRPAPIPPHGTHNVVYLPAHFQQHGRLALLHPVEAGSAKQPCAPHAFLIPLVHLEPQRQRPVQDLVGARHHRGIGDLPPISPS